MLYFMFCYFTLFIYIYIYIYLYIYTYILECCILPNTQLRLLTCISTETLYYESWVNLGCTSPLSWFSVLVIVASTYNYYCSTHVDRRLFCVFAQPNSCNNPFFKTHLLPAGVQAWNHWVTTGMCILRILAGEYLIDLFKGWRPSSAPPDFSTLHFIAVWAWKLWDGDLLQKYSPYVFWKKFMARVFPEELLPISTCYFV